MLVNQYTDWVHSQFENVAQRDSNCPAKVRLEARSSFGIADTKDWWGRSPEWEQIYKDYFPKRLERVGGQELNIQYPAQFDETISVVNSWLHCTGYGILQRMLSYMLRDLNHLDLQAFYVILDTLDRDKVFADSAPKTDSTTFLVKQKSDSFKRQVAKMTASYGHMFVAADALEMILGYTHQNVVLFRDWIGICTAYLFDMDGQHGGPSKERWDEHMKDLLERSV